jgi:hypothetical protein
MFIVYENGDPDDHEEYDCMPFLQAMWRRYIVYRNAVENGEKKLVDLDPCNYHDHKSDGEMTACKKRRGVKG